LGRKRILAAKSVKIQANFACWLKIGPFLSGPGRAGRHFVAPFRRPHSMLDGRARLVRSGGPVEGPAAMHPTRLPELNAILREFSARLSVILGSEVVGIYLHGSLAIGDFDEAASDVDFIVVIDNELTEAQVAEVRVMHAGILALPSPFAKVLEGSYFPSCPRWVTPVRSPPNSTR
jgi:predicted nucleotidyltransferase